MTLESIYYVGQTVAVIAILASLIAVFFQMRQQSQISRSELYLNATTAAAEQFRTLRHDPEFARLLSVSFQDWEALSHNQKLRCHSWHVETGVHLDAILTMRSQNLIDESQTSPWVDNFLLAITTTGGSQWWQETKLLFTPQLQIMIKARLEDPATLPPPATELPQYFVDESDIEKVIGGPRFS